MIYRLPLLLFIAAFTAACVTVNVYFPESAAERAADLFIRDVYGDDANEAESGAADDNPQSMFEPKYKPRHKPAVRGLAAALVDLIIPGAYAQQPDINIQTPAINALKGSMAARHQKLKAGYASGAVGMASNGLIVLRDPKAIDLKQRNQVKQLVAQENKDRDRLYSEVAKANNHPEWEKDIRGIFAQRWVGNAPSGWWYQAGGQWRQK